MDPNQPASLEFHYTPTPEDYITTLRDFTFHDRRTYLVLAIWVAATLVISYFFLRGTFGEGILPGVLVYIIPVMFLYNFVTGPTRIGSQVKGNPAYATPVTWKVTPNGIRILIKDEEIKHAWSDFSATRETPGYFLLFQADDPRIFQFVPKRAFESPEQEQAFREMLEQILK